MDNAMSEFVGAGIRAAEAYGQFLRAGLTLGAALFSAHVELFSAFVPSRASLAIESVESSAFGSRRVIRIAYPIRG